MTESAFTHQKWNMVFDDDDDDDDDDEKTLCIIICSNCSCNRIAYRKHQTLPLYPLF